MSVNLEPSDNSACIDRLDRYTKGCFVRSGMLQDNNAGARSSVG